MAFKYERVVPVRVYGWRGHAHYEFFTCSRCGAEISRPKSASGVPTLCLCSLGRARRMVWLWHVPEYVKTHLTLNGGNPARFAHDMRMLAQGIQKEIDARQLSTN